MVDTLTPDERSKRMSLVRGKDTKPEMVVRKLVYSLGYRYRLHYGKLPGKPDIVFPGRRKVIFVHGCFWHGHTCRQGMNAPKSNESYWIDKREGNRKRDLWVRRRLRSIGWEVLVIWECNCRNVAKVKKDVEIFLDGTHSKRI